MSNITSIYLTGHNLAVKENIIIIGASLLMGAIWSLVLYIWSLEIVRNEKQTKLLMIFEIIIFWLFLWSLGIIGSLAFNQYSLDLLGAIEQVKKSFWQTFTPGIAYILVRYKII